MKQRFGKKIQVLILTLMVIGFPLVSWYYLQSGYQYHKDVLNDLKDYGELPAFNLMDQDGRAFVKDSLQDKIAIVSFINSAKSSAATILKPLATLHEQYDDRNRILFLIHDVNVNSDRSVLQSLAKQFKLEDKNQVFLLTGSNKEMTQLIQQGYKVPDWNEGKGEDGKWQLQKGNLALSELPDYLVLTSTEAVVRNYYDPTDGESLKRLVEQISLTMPREKTEKPKLRRSREK